MGTVYRGFDERLKRPVAVKALRDRYRFELEARARFLREARILSKLNHPAICRVYDLIENPDADYLILEFIHGHTLRDLDPSLDLGEKLRIAEAAAEAISVAHRARIVHRDLKPDNIMVGPDGQVTVLDFGLARPLNGGEPKILPRAQETRESGRVAPPADVPLFAGKPENTATVVEIPTSSGSPHPAPTPRPEATFYTRRHGTMGTVAYMSPEQARGEEVAEPSDLYSFGVVLQELFTRGKAYPPQLPFVELSRRVTRGETLPVEGLDAGLTALIEDLKDPDPTGRPTAEETRMRLRRLIERPERRRRRRLRTLALSLLLTLMVSAAGAVLHSRIRARREAEIAQRFTEEAQRIEWSLRAAHLSPPHDIRATREEVRRLMSGLGSRMEKLGSIGRRPGDTALGRLALALGEFETARAHFQAAWDAGYREPGVSSGLGRALVELYQHELSRLAKSGNPARREIEALKESLRDPAVEHLRRARNGLLGGEGSPPRLPGEIALPPLGPVRALGTPELRLHSIGYAEALIAFQEERWEDALAKARGSATSLAWFYESELLLGRIYKARGDQLSISGEVDDASADYLRARDAYRAAAAVGRSDPRVHMALCDLGLAQMFLEIAARGGDVTPFFEQGVMACGKALEIDPDSPSATRLMADLFFRMAEDEGGRGHDPRPRLEQAAVLTRAALDIDPHDDESWRTLGHIHSTGADWELYHGGDPRPGLDATVAAYREGLRLAPGDWRLWIGLGNAHSLRAEHQIGRGRDPAPGVEAAVTAYRRAAELDPEDYLPHTNMGLALETRARFELARGGDPRPILARVREAAERSLRINPRQADTHHSLAAASLVEAEYSLRLGDSPDSSLTSAFEALDRADDAYADSIYSHLLRAATWLLRAEQEVLEGRDPGPSLAAARESARLARGIDPLDPEVCVLLGSSFRLEARFVLDRDRDPRNLFGRAAEELHRALGLHPDLFDAHLERGRVAILEGRFARRLKNPAEPALRRAETALGEAARILPGSAEVALAQAEVQRLRGQNG